MFAILTGKTQKGKNRVRENGKEWVVKKTVNRVLFDSRQGPWFMVVPVNAPGNGRWVHLTDDKDFSLELREEL